MSYNLNNYLRAHQVKMTPSELEEIDFRVDDYHAVPLSDKIMKKETWGKMFRNPYHRFSLIQGFGDIGFKAFIKYIRDWTAGYPGLYSEKELRKGECLVKPQKPIAKMVHFLWHPYDTILPEFKDEYNVFNPKSRLCPDCGNDLNKQSKKGSEEIECAECYLKSLLGKKLPEE